MSAVKVRAWLTSRDGPAAAGGLRKALLELPDDAGVDPEDLWTLGDSLTYTVQINGSGSGVDAGYDVVFSRRETERAEVSRAAVPFRATVSPKPWRCYANNPMRGMVARKMVPELRRFLEEKLPGYMVPSAFV